jgi:Amidase
VPIGIKDNLWTQGLPTTGGMEVLKDFRPTADATVVRRLNQAGAVLIAKLHMTEGARRRPARHLRHLRHGREIHDGFQPRRRCAGRAEFTPRPRRFPAGYGFPHEAPAALKSRPKK